jgi:3-oxoacyl-[acyl-carrier-protein] synthase-3
MNISRYGNTTAATIPLLLHDYESKFKKGDNIIFASFGAGFTWGAMFLKWAYNHNNFIMNIKEIQQLSSL